MDPEVAPQSHQGRHSQDDEGRRLLGVKLVLAALGAAVAAAILLSVAYARRLDAPEILRTGM